MYMAFCPKCNQLIDVSKTHNGIGFVWHAVHCGYGQDCFGDIFIVEYNPASKESKYDYVATFYDYDAGDIIGHGKDPSGAVKDLIEQDTDRKTND